MQTARRENENNSILLVIERDTATRSGMKRLLEMNGYKVTAVADQREAAEAAARKKHDLILFDSNLPPSKSFSAAQILLQNAELRDSPLLVISVREKFNVPLDHPDADNFTVSYVTNLSRFDELEKLIDCLLPAKI